MGWFEGFEKCTADLGAGSFRYRRGGKRGAPTLLLLHGFPQTHVIWHRVATALSDDFELILPDLRGYGDSPKPKGLSDHSNYSKRVMATDMVELMDRLGVTEFGLIGHDRGARVAHRLALDHASRLTGLVLIDIVPTLDMYAMTDRRFAEAYYHWFHLIQPNPLPERMIGGDPLSYLHAKLGGWGAGGLSHIEPEALADYERCFDSAASIHALCEDYRAAATIDLEHDAASREVGEKITCDTHVLWGKQGVIDALFDPLNLWQAQCAGKVTGTALPCGHFIPEEAPSKISDAIRRLFSKT